MRPDDALALFLAARVLRPDLPGAALAVLGIALEADPSGLLRILVLAAVAELARRGQEERARGRAEASALAARLATAALIALVLGPFGSLR